MKDWLKHAGGWAVELETKPDMEACLERVYAWYEGELLDRPPVRFSRHNEEYERRDASGRVWPSLKDRWFDAEYQLEAFLSNLRKKSFLGETFPVYWPNLGPNVLAASYGCPYTFGEVTAWTEPILSDLSEGRFPLLDWNSEYIQKLDELTDLALERAGNRFLVGYTDLHPGLDWCAALRGTEDLLLDMYDAPEEVLSLAEACLPDFFRFYDRYDAKLKARGQLSVTWMNIPSFGKLHIPSCDFAAMISKEHFAEFAMPGLIKECAYMSHNIFHLDGKDVARHVDQILELPNLRAIQWVQGVGEDQPIMQWIPLIKRIQAAGVGVVLDIALGELEAFISEMRPEGLYLCIATDSVEEEQAVLERVTTW